MQDRFPSSESLENFIQIDCPDLPKLKKYLADNRIAAFLLDSNYQLHIGTHGNHAPIIHRLRSETGMDPNILEKGVISPSQHRLIYETSSPQTRTIEMTSADLEKIHAAIASKIRNYIGEF